jgi:transposase-like protein
MTEQISELKQRLVVGRKQDGRCCYDPQAKRELIEAAFQPGVSVAKLALAYGINAKLLRTWMTKHQRQLRISRNVTVDFTAS